MAYNYAIIDSDTGALKRGGLAADAGPLYVDQSYVVGVGGQQNFTTTQPFVTLTLIDVFVNGILMEEGSGNDYQRNVALNRIEFTNSIPKDAKVRVRVYP